MDSSMVNTFGFMGTPFHGVFIMLFIYFIINSCTGCALVFRIGGFSFALEVLRCSILEALLFCMLNFVRLWSSVVVCYISNDCHLLPNLVNNYAFSFGLRMLRFVCSVRWRLFYSRGGGDFSAPFGESLTLKMHYRGLHPLEISILRWWRLLCSFWRVFGTQGAFSGFEPSWDICAPIMETFVLPLESLWHSRCISRGLYPLEIIVLRYWRLWCSP